MAITQRQTFCCEKHLASLVPNASHRVRVEFKS
jgi:hypothetical protein